MLLLLPLPILLFPDGHLPLRHMRWTARIYVTLAVVAIVDVGAEQSRAFTDHPLKINASGELPNPSHSAAANAAAGVWFALYALICFSWVISQVIAYHRSTGERRQQLKWLMSGAATCIGGLVVGVTLSEADSPIVSAVSGAGFVAIAALPIGLGVGVMKYRLYEIDRLISRTLSYLIITGLLALVFVSIVFVATNVLPFSSPVAVAASTLAAAALFNPLRQARPASGRPAVQPCPLQRRGDRRGVHDAAPRRGRPRHGAPRVARRRRRRRRAEPRLGLDQTARPALSRLADETGPPAPGRLWDAGWIRMSLVSDPRSVTFICIVAVFGHTHAHDCSNLDSFT